MGEIGGDAEERAADYIKANVSKPVVGYVADSLRGRQDDGPRRRHVSGSSGTAAAKKEALEAAGVKVGRLPRDRLARPADPAEPVDRHQPHAPVVVGVGQAAERIDDAYYRGMSAVELAAAGASAALEDCDADAAKVAASIDTIAGVRQFEISGPAKAMLGKSNKYPRSVADRLGADPARAILEVVGGQGPQHLIDELAGEIATGRSEVALVFGSVPTSTRRYFAGWIIRPVFSETVDGSQKHRGHALDGTSAATRSFTDSSTRPPNTVYWRMPARAGTGLGGR